VTFEEVLPWLKAGHDCYRRSQHGLGLGDVKTNVSVRRVPGTYGDAYPIGFIEVTYSRGSGHLDRSSEHFKIWSPAVDDILADDWEDLTASLEEYEKKLALQEAKAAKATEPETAV